MGNIIKEKLICLLLQVMPNQNWDQFPLELLCHINSYIFGLKDEHQTLDLLKSFYATVPQKLLHASENTLKIKFESQTTTSTKDNEIKSLPQIKDEYIRHRMPT